MVELLLAGVLFCLASGRRHASIPVSKPYKHPSLEPRRYEIVSRATWDKHDRPYLGPRRERTAEHYRTRFINRKVKELF